MNNETRYNITISTEQGPRILLWWVQNIKINGYTLACYDNQGYRLEFRIYENDEIIITLVREEE